MWKFPEGELKVEQNKLIKNSNKKLKWKLKETLKWKPQNENNLLRNLFR